MTYQLVGNKWLDQKTRDICNFSSELDSCACHETRLNCRDREKIREHLEAIERVIQRAYKDVLKPKKK